ncbi:Acetyltransferase (GNAT) family protein [compost metagenome]
MKITLRPVGALSLYNIDDVSKNAEFGRFMIGDTLARRIGLGKKTLEAICEFSRETLCLENLYLEVLSDNEAAIKVYDSVGFKKENEFISRNTIKMSKQL